MLRTLLTTLALAALLPAAATAEDLKPPPCHRASGPPRLVATLVTDSANFAAQIVACDRATGRRTVLRRGNFQRWSPHASFVRRLGRPAAVGTTVTWGELTGSDEDRTRWHQTQISVDLRHSAVRHRRALDPDLGVSPYGGNLDTYAFPGGALAYMVIGHDETDGTVMLDRPHHRPRTVATGVYAMHSEDGRTLLWQTWNRPRFRPSWHALDIAPLPRDAEGCPIRSTYRTEIDTPWVRVSRSSLFDYYGVFRACWKATGRDDIVVSDTDYESTYPLVMGSRVLLRTMYVDKYQQCTPGENGRFVVLDVRTRRFERQGDLACADYDAFVLTGSGAPAWISGDDAGIQTVRTVLPDGSTAELDSGPPGSIGALATDGTTFTWTRAGEPRSAPVR